MNKNILLIVISLFCISLLNLLFNFNPPYWDELAIGIDAYAVAHTGRDIHGNSWFQAIYPSYGDYKAPLPILLTSLSVRMFGLHEWSVRLPFFIMLWLSMIGLAWLMQQLGEESKTAKTSPIIWTILLLTIVTPWYWHFCHIGFESGMSFALLIWAVALFLWGLRKRRGGIIMGGLIGILMVYTYFSARVILPLFTFGLIICFGSKSIKAWKWILTGLILFILGIQPLFHSPFYQQSEQLRWSAANILDGKSTTQSAQLILENNSSFLARIIYHRYWFLAKAFLQNYLKHFSFSFLFFDGDANLRHHSSWGGQLLAVSLPFLFLGFYWLAKNWRQKITWLIISWLLVAPITASVPIETPHASRAIYLLLPLILIIYFGVVQLTEMLKKYYKVNINNVYAILIIMLLSNFGIYLEDYIRHYPKRSQSAWQIKNQDMALLAIKEEVKYSLIYISDAYRLPVLSILFYQPELIKEIQPSDKKLANQNYTWINGFGKYRLGDVNGQNSDKNILVLK